MFVGGDGLFFVNGQTRRGLAALDPETAALLPFDANLGFGGAFDFDVVGNTLYVAGLFIEAQGQPRRGAAAFDPDTSALRPWSPMLYGGARAIAATGERVILGGFIYSAGPIERQGFARIDLTTGQPLPERGNVEKVSALLRLGDVIVMANSNGLEAYRAATMEPLPWRHSVDGTVSVLATDGARLFVGGSFAAIGGVPRQHLAAFDLASGALSDWAPWPDAPVDAMAVDGRVVYVGGRFRSFPGYGRGSGAALDAVSGQVLTWNPKADGWIEALAVLPNRVVVAGSFGRLTGVVRVGVGSVDKSVGTPLEIGPFSSSPTHAAVVFRDTLLLGGQFYDV
ncbi:MAG: hypothetical protein ACRD1H_08170, partial [Vicinamibacterales bacterium]